MSEPLEPVDRLAALEAKVDVLSALSAGEGERLSSSVDRLGLNATALSEALQQVDRNQQRLTQLGKELAETKAQVVPRAEHDRHEQERRTELLAYRRQLARKIYAWSICSLALLTGLGLFGASYIEKAHRENYRVCVKENEFREGQRRYLEAVRDVSTNEILRAEADRSLREFEAADCEALL